MSDLDLKPRYLSELNRFEEKKKLKQVNNVNKEDGGALNPLALMSVNYLSVFEKESIIKVYRDNMTQKFSDNNIKSELAKLEAPKKIRGVTHTIKKPRAELTFDPKAWKKNLKELFGVVKFNSMMKQDIKDTFERQLKLVMSWDRIFNPVELKQVNPLLELDDDSYRQGNEAQIKAFADQKIRNWIGKLNLKTNRNKMNTDLSIFTKTTNPVDIEKVVSGIVGVIGNTTQEKHDYDKLMLGLGEKRKEEAILNDNFEIYTRNIFPQRFNQLMDNLIPLFRKMKEENSLEESKKDNYDYPGDLLFEIAGETLKNEQQNSKQEHFNVPTDYQDDKPYDYLQSEIEFIKENAELIDKMNHAISVEKESLRSNIPLKDKRITMTHKEYMDRRQKQYEGKMKIHESIPFNDKKEFGQQRYANDHGKVRKMTYNEENYLKYFDAFKVIKKIFKGQGTDSFSGNLSNTIFKTQGLKKEEFDKNIVVEEKVEAQQEDPTKTLNNCQQENTAIVKITPVSNIEYTKENEDKVEIDSMIQKGSVMENSTTGIQNFEQNNTLISESAANKQKFSNVGDSTKPTDANEKTFKDAFLTSELNVDNSQLMKNQTEYPLDSIKNRFARTPQQNFIRKNFNVRSNISMPQVRIHKDDSSFTIKRKENIIKSKYKTNQNFYDKTKLSLGLTEQGFFDNSCMQTNNASVYRHKRGFHKTIDKKNNFLDNVFADPGVTSSQFAKIDKKSSEPRTPIKFNHTTSQMSNKSEKRMDFDDETEEKKPKAFDSKVSPMFMNQTKKTIKSQINVQAFNYIDEFKNDNFTFSYNANFNRSKLKGSRIFKDIVALEHLNNELLEQAESKLCNDQVSNIYQPVEDLEETRNYLRFMTMERQRKEIGKGRMNVAKRLNELKSHKTDMMILPLGIQKSCFNIKG